MKKTKSKPRFGMFYGKRATKKSASMPVSNTKFDLLRAAGLKVQTMSPAELKSRTHLPGLKRFAELSMEKDRSLIEALAKNYAAIFNVGFVAEEVGIETYCAGPGGKESFYFGDLRQIKKAPEKQSTIIHEMGKFYYSISMNDTKTRTFFVSEFGKNLRGDLPKLFRQAIRGFRVG